MVRNLPASTGDEKDASSIPGLERSPEGNGSPLQYSCLENPMDWGAWWATVHRVTKSQTWLRPLYTHMRGEGKEFVAVHICQNLDLFIHREQRRWKNKHPLLSSRGQESSSCSVDTVSAMASPPCGMTGSLGSMSQEPPFSCWLVLIGKLRDFPSCVDLGISTLIRHSSAVDICLWQTTQTLPRSAGSAIPRL